MLICSRRFQKATRGHMFESSALCELRQFIIRRSYAVFAGRIHSICWVCMVT